MFVCLRLSVLLLLLVPAAHLASAEAPPTDSPGRTIDKSWNRGAALEPSGPSNAVEEAEISDDAAAESSNDYRGVASGSMANYSEEEESLMEQGRPEDQSDDQAANTTAPPQDESEQDAMVHPTLDAGEEPLDSTLAATQEVQVQTSPQNSSGSNFSSTDAPEVSPAPENNSTLDSSAEPDQNTPPTNATEADITETPTPSSETQPESNQTSSSTSSSSSSTSSSSTSSSTLSTDATDSTSSDEAPPPPQGGNRTDQSGGGSSDRGVESDPRSSEARRGAWAAVLGTALAVGVVALVAYVILRNKHQKGFSHRKLVEEYPSDPVLRLDNSEPLDLNFGGSAYYNPGLQGDNIQMSSLPGRR